MTKTLTYILGGASVLMEILLIILTWAVKLFGDYWYLGLIVMLLIAAVWIVILGVWLFKPGEEIPEERRIWGTMDCKKWFEEVYIIHHEHDHVDSSAIGNDYKTITIPGKSVKAHVFIWKLRTLFGGDDKTFLMDMEVIERGTPKYLNLIKGHDDDKIMRAAKDLCSEKEQKEIIKRVKKDPITDKTTEEVSSEKTGKEDDDKIGISGEGEQ